MNQSQRPKQKKSKRQHKQATYSTCSVVVFFFWSLKISHSTDRIYKSNVKTSYEFVIPTYTTQEPIKSNITSVRSIIHSDTFPHQNLQNNKLLSISKHELMNPEPYGRILPQCLQYLPNYVAIGSHHKSGNIFSNQIKYSFFKYCNIFNFHSFRDMKHRKKRIFRPFHRNNDKYFTRYHHWMHSFPSHYFFANKNTVTAPTRDNDAFAGNNVQGSLEDADININETKFKKMKMEQLEFIYHKGSDANSVAILHFVRAPLNMILSAYNYHKLCPQIEHTWINTPISYQSKQENWAKYITVDFWQNKIANKSTCEFYNTGDDDDELILIDRLYFEFVRVRQIHFNSMKIVYQLLQNVDFGYNFKMEDYTASSDNFDKFADYLIRRVFNLKFDATKRSHVKQYQKLMNLLRNHDVNRKTIEVNGKTDMHSLHFTGSLYNKTYQTDLLLKHHFQVDDGNVVNVCHEIKYMMLELDYEWKFDQYC